MPGTSAGPPRGGSSDGRFWSPVTCLFSPADNLWSAYADKGVFVERKGTPSVPAAEESRASGLPYVLTDIVTYFTMLVGIYFPSVTGEASAFQAAGAATSLPPCLPPAHPPTLSHDRSACLCPPPPRFPATLPSSPQFSLLFGSKNEPSAPCLFCVGSTGGRVVGGRFVPCSPERPVLLEVTSGCSVALPGTPGALLVVPRSGHGELLVARHCSCPCPYKRQLIFWDGP